VRGSCYVVKHDAEMYAREYRSQDQARKMDERTERFRRGVVSVDNSMNADMKQAKMGGGIVE